MNNILYSVIFSGEIAEGKDTDVVKKKVSAIFNDKYETEKLFSGKQFTVKKNIDMQHALKIRRIRLLNG